MSLSPWSLKLGAQIVGTVLIGEPVAKGRPQFNHKSGNVYTPKTTREAEKRARALLSHVAPPRPIADDVVLWATFHCSPRKPPDGDNLAKLLVDASVGLIVADDCQVVEWHIRVFARSPKPRTEFVLTRVPD